MHVQFCYIPWGWAQTLDLTTLRRVGLHPGQLALLLLRPLNHHSINIWPVLTKRATLVQHQHLDDHMLLFVACYKGSLRTKFTKWDSITARPCVYNGTSTVWPERMRFLKFQLVNTARTGPRVHDWPRSRGERRKKNRKPDLSLFKKVQERERMPKLSTTCTSRQVRWITMTTDTHLSIF